MFDRESAIAALAAKEGLTPALARMAVDEDLEVQARNVQELKAALGAKPVTDAAKAERVADLKKAYNEARERRDVQEMISCKHHLGQLGVFNV